MSTSQMTDEQTVVLSRRANETISDWVGKVVTPTLLIRCLEGELSVYIVTGMPPNPELGNYQGATLMLRFDKEPAITWSADTSTSNDSLFLADGNAESTKFLIERLVRSQTLRFRFTPFNSAPREASFSLGGLAAVVGKVQRACGWDPAKDKAKAEADRLAQQREAEERERERAEQETRDRAEYSRQLGSDNPTTREMAVRVLAEQGERAEWAVQTIAAMAAGDSSETARAAALATLVNMRSEKARAAALNLLTARLNDSSHPERGAAATMVLVVLKKGEGATDADVAAVRALVAMSQDAEFSVYSPARNSLMLLGRSDAQGTALLRDNCGANGTVDGCKQAIRAVR